MKNSLKLVAIKFSEAGAFEFCVASCLVKARSEFYTIYAHSVFHIVDLNNKWLFPYQGLLTQRYATVRACLHGGGGLQVGEVTRLGGVTRLSISSVIFM